MEDLGWRRRRGSSPVARRGARQRAGLTPASASNTLSCQRETPESDQPIKNPLDSDHGIYRCIYSAGQLGFYVRAYCASLPPHTPDMLTVRIQAIDGAGTYTLPDFQPCRLLTSLRGHYPLGGAPPNVFSAVYCSAE